MGGERRLTQRHGETEAQRKKRKSSRGDAEARRNWAQKDGKGRKTRKAEGFMDEERTVNGAGEGRRGVSIAVEKCRHAFVGEKGIPA